MILNTTPQDQAVMSNVGQVGEFRIRNSAKAFNILSSGLYANKVRAVIRELSCNAVDSHMAASKQGTPFDVHLPTLLEPWFSIRDYGTGLSHDQVTQIYTTYFESTKTDSNDYIGALGLGSKSPFSYTDNFTVTAVKHGIKGIYTAFINDAGVPSIAAMGQEDTTEPAGVEIKFAVNDRNDFDKFRQEARQVYTYFALRPVVAGVADFKFTDVEYDTKDIVPGVHSYKRTINSVAVMGNIAYPIQVPQADTALGSLRELLTCGLELHFAIGELDFQASREGLSYIPQTIAAIQRKLEQVNNALSAVVAKEADVILNLWDRAIFLYKKNDNQLWKTAVVKYATDTKLSTFDATQYYGFKTFELTVDELAKQHNIVIRGFECVKHSKSYPNRKTSTRYSDQKNAQGHYDMLHYWGIAVDTRVHFVVNDTNVGALERAKHHYRNLKPDYATIVFVLDKADKTKSMNVDTFMQAIHNPTADRFVNASTLHKKQRADSGIGKNVTILALQERGSGRYDRRRGMVWRDAGKADSFDAASSYYYLPLSGFDVISKSGMSDVKQFYTDLEECGVDGLKRTIYGVRKGDIEFIKTQQNWINIEDQISAELKTVDAELMMSLVINAVDRFNLLQYSKHIVDAVTDAKSPYVKLVTQFEGYTKIRYNEQSLKRLCQRYAPGGNFSPDAVVQKFVDECSAINKLYPLLQFLRSAPNKEIADYINLIDTQKGI